MAERKTVPVGGHNRSTPKPIPNPPGKRHYPKPGTKPVHVDPYKRSPPSPKKK